MIKNILLAGAALGAIAAPAMAQDALTLQLKWVTQAQFAGYYVALEKGFYEAENLDVTILPGGPDVAPPQALAGGAADIMTDWVPSALAVREGGLPVVNIAQPFASSGLMLTCWKDAGFTGPQDFKGHTIGVWFGGNEYPFLNWMSAEGISVDGGEDGVTILRQGFNVDPLLQRQADCISTMTYNEYGQVLEAGVSPDELTNFVFEDLGVATLEDGLWVLEDRLSDEAFVDSLVRFVRASMEGWKYAEANPEEAAAIVLEFDETGAQTEAHQVFMMSEIAKLTAGSNGALDPAAFDRTVEMLMQPGSDPVITAVPEGAWTHVITDAALN
ncbi:ABC transporter substrate-binding protein [Ketogulonicigenium vulgare]|uniref:Thiamine pyrimidine synthase n=1 Tax=Ketogulonicigenium vulgare (strain WSH-001) TaxID=759362 RepID=F9Y3C4_KETVW|nr:ABC transporter substrate-binding protein [Ketogulonicigenium vulgare]ADO42161.1 ABC transporter, periplasmic substrate-binding protein [Ketogulonicigenium vulgare Y25]AEM40365.1 ABC-type nitrate/sulfonate/bicarbonate transportsystems periplasmic components-like protein [Ketogulonicigenium vulgare WSH-001]ALJ80554.1 nitrate ABC transporter substrate-binding protein [Ketogulonicigenium vulgare]ANW33375.1 nitrate ABC transporter substrate-binding protein [Ketogulonicigenium vulgare]AOZ54078.1